MDYSRTSVAPAGLALALLALSLSRADVSFAGPVLLTGHDPDWHATQGPNVPAAMNLLNAALGFVLDPGLNSFAAGGNTKFLFAESFGDPPPGCTQGVNGLTAIGLVDPDDFEKHAADTLDSELDLLGKKYAALVVASDHGGNLQQAELDILNVRAADIAKFVTAGGGLFAMAESNGCGNTPNGGRFGFVPIALSSIPLGQAEQGFVVTPFGRSLGITAADVSGNVSHNVFLQAAAGFSVVDLDGSNRILTVAGPDVSTAVECGNGIVEPGEQCDDGNKRNGDGCEDNTAAGGTCTLTCPPCCGNGVVENGEQCDDGNTVGGDCCSVTCQFEISGRPCAAALACTNPDLCDGRGACIGEVPAGCVDGDPCTVDSCNDVGCVNAMHPHPYCLEGAKASFTMKSATDPAKAKLVWVLKKGGRFAATDLGDPVNTTQYTMCIYDESADVVRLAGSLTVGPSQRWQSKAPKGWKYKDKTATQDGVMLLQLVSGAGGKTKVKLKAKGATAAWPVPFDVGKYFDQASAVTVQLVNSTTRTCLSSVFPAPAKKDNAEQFKDKVP